MLRREDPKFAGSACRGAFKLGGNSSCRQHIRSHYAEYLKRCAEEGCTPQEHCMPRDLLKKKKLQEAIAAGKKKKAAAQGTLDTVVTKRDLPGPFKTKNTILAIAQYFACKDIVSLLICHPFNF